LKKSGLAPLIFFLVFLLLIQVGILLNMLSVLGTGKSVLARDQVCRMAVEPLEVCLTEKLVDGVCHVWRSVVMV